MTNRTISIPLKYERFAVAKILSISITKIVGVTFQNKKLLIFDLDGTLINSIPDLTAAINKTLSHFNLNSFTIEEVTPFIGNGAKMLVKRAFETSSNHTIEVKALEEALDYFKNVYQENVCEHTFLYPGVKETLQELKNRGYTLAICTNKPYRFVEPILEKLEIKAFFALWLGEESLAEKKPNPMPLLHLARELKASPEECLMIGDSKNDIVAAKNASMDSIGLSYGYNYNENIKDYNPELVLDNFKHLLKIL